MIRCAFMYLLLCVDSCWLLCCVGPLQSPFLVSVVASDLFYQGVYKYIINNYVDIKSVYICILYS